MRTLLARAAEHFQATPVGDPTFGWGDRTIGARVIVGGAARWLRVVREHPDWITPNWWHGNADAGAISDVPRPEIFGTHEFQADAYQVRGELMSVLPGQAVSPAATLENEPELPVAWWADLRAAVDAIRRTPTDRGRSDQERVARRLGIFFGDRVDPTIDRWETAHGDLHWANLMVPELGIVDWELWGTEPAGFDAATLRCHSLLEPAIARRVHDTFVDILDTPDGVRSQLYVITWLLMRADHGDHPQLVLPLHRLANELIAELASTRR